MNDCPVFPLAAPPVLRVHILTDGHPQVSVTARGLHAVENALIGKDFHWNSCRRLLFRGKMEISGDRLFNIIPAEEYIESVIASEMKASAHPELLRTHAIISRSWALGKILGRSSRDCADGKTHDSHTFIDWADEADHTDCDICNDDHCQRYQGVIEDNPEAAARAREAVSSTAGLILTAREGLVDARFSKCCGGKTELFSTCWQDADPSYLQSFPDPFCNLSDLSPLARRSFLASVLNDYDIPTPFDKWSVEISKDTLRQNIRSKLGLDTGEIHTVKPESIGPSGRIRMLAVEADGGLFHFGKELVIRRILSPSHLYSSLFSITDTGESLRLDGRGWGHGVGLCQIGAARMADIGRSADEILSFYYPSSKITKAYNL